MIGWVLSSPRVCRFDAHEAYLLNTVCGYGDLVVCARQWGGGRLLLHTAVALRLSGLSKDEMEMDLLTVRIMLGIFSDHIPTKIAVTLLLELSAGGFRDDTCRGPAHAMTSSSSSGHSVGCRWGGRGTRPGAQSVAWVAPS